jgi:pilus assembly protein CpaE
MKDVIRVVLVDPNQESCQFLRRLLGGVNVLWIAEVFTTYQGVANPICEIGPDLCLVTLDTDPTLAVELIGNLTQAMPKTVVLPASASCDSLLILKSIRAGAREFLTLPADATELLEIVMRLFKGRKDTQVSSDRGPQTITVTGAAGESVARHWRSTWPQPWPPVRNRRPSYSTSI